MQDLKKLESSELVDLLTKETTRFYNMGKIGGEKNEYNQCRATIKEIQSELENRKIEKANNKIR